MHFLIILPTSQLCLCESMHDCWTLLDAAQAQQMEELVCPCSTVLNVKACTQRFGALSALSFCLSLFFLLKLTHIFMFTL